MSDANRLTMDDPVETSLLDRSAQGIIGKPIDRIEGPLKVAGRATYAAEYDVPDLAYGFLVRATVGTGTLVGVNPDSVRDTPGVIDVITDVDTFIRAPQQGGETDAPTQGVKDIAYFGEIVAIVVAESFEAARDAGQRLVIECDGTGDGRFDFAACRDQADTPPDGVAPAHSGQGDVEAALAAADVTIDATFTTPSQNSAAMEPHAAIASWDEDGNLTIRGAYQMLDYNRKEMADTLGLDESQVRFVAPYVGGGFGSKLGISQESVCGAIAAKRVGRPVKTVMSRQQVFDATIRRSNTEQRVRLGATNDGRITAIAHETLTSNLEGEDFFEPAGLATHFMYGGDNRLITHDIVRLNWMLAGSMRAPGEAVGMLALEGAIDELAEKLDIDPIALRKINDPERDPEKHVPYSSRALSQCLDEGAEAFGWDARNATPGDRREGEWMFGIGVAAAGRSNMLMKSAARVAIDAEGRATVATDMTDIGTGSYTILGQIAGELLGLPIERVTVELGDTRLPAAAGSGGSWGAGSAGSSVYLACAALRETIAAAMDCDPDELTLKDGEAIAGNRKVPLAELVGDGIEATGEIAPGKEGEAVTQAAYGAHFAEVAVSAVTGEVRVKRMLGVFAAGRILNEKTARSQCLGGMTFGIGSALSEALIHDRRNGKIVNRDLAEYHLPVNADVPQIEVRFVHERDVHANPLHAKGIGELGISGAGAAIANAVYNATGIRVRDYPLTLDKLLAGLPAS